MGCGPTRGRASSRASARRVAIEFTQYPCPGALEFQTVDGRLPEGKEYVATVCLRQSVTHLTSPLPRAAALVPPVALRAVASRASVPQARPETYRDVCRTPSTRRKLRDPPGRRPLGQVQVNALPRPRGLEAGAAGDAQEQLTSHDPRQLGHCPPHVVRVEVLEHVRRNGHVQPVIGPRQLCEGASAQARCRRARAITAELPSYIEHLRAHFHPVHVSLLQVGAQAWQSCARSTS
eukprot:scaffold89646_cov63-Phaeocystis_antarctica.AAC.2